jgi:hypothetical protein
LHGREKEQSGTGKWDGKKQAYLGWIGKDISYREYLDRLPHERDGGRGG